MTIQEKIDILERAIPKVNTHYGKVIGICLAIYETIGPDDSNAEDWQEVSDRFMEECGILLPFKIYGGLDSYSWPLTPKGDEQRRAFLRSHIERLKKELI